MKNILKTLAVALVVLAGHAKADSLALGAKKKPVDLNIKPVVEGHDCANFQTGDIGMSSDGLILSCQSGRTWARNNQRLIVDRIQNNINDTGVIAFTVENRAVIHATSNCIMQQRWSYGTMLNGTAVYATTKLDGSVCSRDRSQRAFSHDGPNLNLVASATCSRVLGPGKYTVRSQCEVSVAPYTENHPTRGSHSVQVFGY